MPARMPVWLLFAATAAAHPGIGIVADGHGNDLKQVWKIDRSGKKSVVVPRVHTHELYAANLYGEHLWYEGDATKKWGHRVWRLDARGKVVEVYGAREGFRTDYSFVRDRAGNGYWMLQGDCRTRKRGSRSLCRTAPQGTVSTVAAGLGDIRWIAVSPDGTAYLIDGVDLLRVRPDGAVKRMATALGDRGLRGFGVADRHLVMGLSPDAQGNVYVAVYGSGKVKKIDPLGRETVFCQSGFPYGATGVTLTGDAVWVLEYTLTGSVRVSKYTYSGRRVATY